ncbi:MAG TPA: zinc ribbon domain-containing protein [Blastocatellia bacterium]|nr:zinc ribbon domain-containing protein [Blastocatellia bacterium]
MFCPTCAANNPEDTNFCRACGASLEAVALALSGQLPITDKPAPTPADKWATLRSRAINRLAQGAILTVSSLLVGLALGLFWKNKDWMIIWLIFFGWVGGWGVIQLALGLGGLLESKLMLRHLNASSAPSGATTRTLSE